MDKQPNPDSNNQGNKTSSRSRRKRKRRNANSLQDNLFRVAVGVLLLGGIIFFLWSTSESPVAAPDREPGTTKSDFEVTLVKGTAKELVSESKSLDKDLYRQPPLPIPEQLPILDKKLKIGRRLEELNENEESKTKGVEIQLETLTYLNTLNEIHNLNNQSVEGELNDLAKGLYDSPNPKLRYNSRLAISLGDLHRYLKSKERKDFDTFLASYLDPEVVAHERSSVKSIQRIMAFLEQAGRQEHYDEFIGLIKTRLLASNNGPKRRLGESLHDRLVIGKIDYPDLNRRLMDGEPEAIAELEELVDNLATDTNLSSVPVVKTISLVESVGSTGDVELERRLADKLRQTLSLPISKDKKDMIKSTFVDYDVRVACIGKPFEFGNSKNIAGEQLSTKLESSKTTVVIFFSGKNKDSLWAINLVKDYSFLTRNGVSWVLLNIDNNQQLSTLKMVKSKYPDAEVSHVTIAGDVCKKCPITKVPYILVVHDGVAVLKNVNPDRLRSVLEELAMTDK